MKCTKVARMIALIAVMGIAKSALAADLTPAAVYGFWRGHDLKAPGLLYVSLVIRNDSKKIIRVPTKYTVEFIVRMPTRYVVKLWVKPEKFYDVDTVIPESDLSIVELRPGDVAWISWKQDYDRAPELPIYVKFVVDKKIADRYNLWSGELEVKAGIDSWRKKAFEAVPPDPLPTEPSERVPPGKG